MLRTLRLCEFILYIVCCYIIIRPSIEHLLIDNEMAQKQDYPNALIKNQQREIVSTHAINSPLENIEHYKRLLIQQSSSKTSTKHIIKQEHNYRTIHDYYRNNSQIFRSLSWVHYNEVNGLKNNDIVMLIMSTAVMDGSYIRQRIIPSSRTWARLLMNVFVVIEDSVASRFYFRHCNMIEYTNFTSFKCPHEPLYVLTRNCTDAYYDATGICCKVDESIQFLVTAKSDLFSHMKYLFITDDDTFWRIDQVLMWTSVIDKKVNPNIPIVGNGARTVKESEMGTTRGVFHVEGCKEISTNGWYQPVMMNRKAVEILSKSTASYSVRSICTIFDISQDLGLGILFWMYEFYHLYMPGVYTNPSHKGYDALKSDLMAVHAVRNTKRDDCGGKKWPNRHRYNQHMMIGCGKIDVQPESHDIKKSISMYDAWNWFAENGANVLIESNDEENDIVEWVQGPKGLEPLLERLIGYNTTSHSRKYNISHVWKPFTLLDCEIPGYIKP